MEALSFRSLRGHVSGHPAPRTPGCWQAAPHGAPLESLRVQRLFYRDGGTDTLSPLPDPGAEVSEAGTADPASGWAGETVFFIDSNGKDCF